MEAKTSTPKNLVIDLVTELNQDAAFTFHRAHLGDFILPLPRNSFEEITKHRQAFVVEADGQIAGFCYVKPDGKELDDVARWEFGGLYLEPALRGQGIANVLSAVAIAQVTRADPKPVMAYVHRENTDGLDLLVQRLGFEAQDQVIRIGPDELKGHLRRDGSGFATAHVLQLPDTSQTRVAAILERFANDPANPSQPTTLTLAEGLFPSLLPQGIADACQS